jgi:hypothetical protein
MYRIPKDVSFSFLLGSTITEVREFEHNYIVLKLDPHREIHVEGGRRVEGWIAEDVPATVAGLVGRRIEAVTVASETELVVTVSGDIRFRMFDDSDQYECIHIYPEAIII